MKTGPRNLPDPLVGLKDIHLPAPPSWWPPAPGWWLLAVLLLLLAGGAFWFRRRHRARNRYLRLALKELEQIRPYSRVGAAATAKRRLLEELSALLRRFALAQWPTAGVAELQGEAWLEFLLGKVPAAARSQAQKELRPLLLLYAPDRELEKLELDPVALKDGVRKWLLGCKRKA